MTDTTAGEGVVVPRDLLDKAAFALSKTVLGPQLFAALAAQPSAGAQGEAVAVANLEIAELEYRKVMESVSGIPLARYAALQGAILAVSALWSRKPIATPAQPDTGDVLAGESYFETGADGEWKVRRPASTFDDLIADLHRRADSCHDLNKPDQTEHARGRLHGKEGAYRHAADMVRELKALSALRQPDTGDVAALREALEPFAHLVSAGKLPAGRQSVHLTTIDGQWLATLDTEDFWRIRYRLAALSKPNAPGREG